MKNIKRLGIWMDHSDAFLMELTNEMILTTRVFSDLSNQESESDIYKGEKQINKKERHLQLYYYRKLGEIIKKYQEVILFGPTDAKNELLNLLKDDHLYENIIIDSRNSDKMTESQMQTFVRDFFK